MTTVTDAQLRDQLLERRARLQAVTATAADSGLLDLLALVDRALDDIEDGTYGRCDVCGDPVEPERLAADPLVRLCIDHLTPSQRRDLERDLETAARIQAALLPRGEPALPGWDLGYRYRPAGPVSGDYVDLVPANGGGAWFAFGDVSGKGVSASILMAHLQAILRGLAAGGSPLAELLAAANRIFCESTLAGHYATAVIGRLDSDGVLELGNAGHWSPLLRAGGQVRALPATGLPLGMFCDARYGVERFELAAGDALVLYTDGLSESRNGDGEEYGSERLAAVLERGGGASSAELVEACLADLAAFTGGGAPGDDLTVMAVRRVG
jgi:sigma-B regulation protein RsbU (phosphoserine phosphatase)